MGGCAAAWSTLHGVCCMLRVVCYALYAACCHVNIRCCMLHIAFCSFALHVVRILLHAACRLHSSIWHGCLLHGACCFCMLHLCAFAAAQARRRSTTRTARSIPTRGTTTWTAQATVCPRRSEGTCNIQHTSATCNMQRTSATCNIKDATYKMQHTSAPHSNAKCNLQDATYGI